MKTIHLFFSLVSVVALTLVLGGIEPPAAPVSAQTTEMPPVEALETIPKAETENVPKAPEKPRRPRRSQPPAKKPAGCGPHSAKEVYDILVEIGVPKLSAIQQTGSWKTESGGTFNQCQTRGDGGLAHGLNSWHPGRRHDMPTNLYKQIKWAIYTEMPRDCRSCFDRFMAADSVESVRKAIKDSTRWGVLGNRWVYADQLADQLQ